MMRFNQPPPQRPMNPAAPRQFGTFGGPRPQLSARPMQQNMGAPPRPMPPRAPQMAPQRQAVPMMAQNRPAPPRPVAPRAPAPRQQMMGANMGAMMSDERSKKRIQELESLNEQYSALLDGGDETTRLGEDEERAFQAWAKKNNIRDVDHPDSHYDYRGFWKDSGGPAIKGGVDHFPDTYKQHGHPTFSRESKYSKGEGDGGRWVGEDFVPAPKYSSAEYPRPKAPPTADLDRSNARALADAGSYSYEYKDPGAPGAASGRQAGPMAQELEGIPGVVKPGPDGLKRVDTGRLALATASATGDQERRLRELEGEFDALSDSPGPAGSAEDLDSYFQSRRGR